MKISTFQTNQNQEIHQDSNMIKSVGYFIRVNRELQGLTLRELQKKCGISHVQISKYERNIDDIPLHNLDKITKALNCTYYEDLELENKIENLFSNLRNNIFYSTLNVEQTKSALLFLENSALSTRYAHVVLLIKYIIAVICNDITVDEYGNILDHLNMSDSLEKQVFLQFKSCRLNDEKKYKESLETILNALPVHFEEKQYGMLNYYSAMQYSALNQSHQALDALLKAKQIFRKYNNFVREMHCDLLFGNIYLKSNQYIEAYEYYSYVENEIKVLKSCDSLLPTVKLNQALLCIFMKKYDQTLEILNDLNKNDVQVIEIFALCYSLLKQYSKTCDWANKGLELAERDSVEYYLFKIYIIIGSQNKNKKTLEELIQLYNKIEDQIQNCTKVIIIDWIIEIAEIRNDYKLAYEYSKLIRKYI